VLAGALASNTKSYTLKLLDGLSNTNSFQVMVQALPAQAPVGENIVDSLPDRLEKFGRAYALSALVTVEGPLPCTGLNNEQGSCVSPASCTSVGGTLLYKGRRNERQRCDQLADTNLQCKKRVVAAPSACLARAHHAVQPTSRRRAQCSASTLAPSSVQSRRLCNNRLVRHTTWSCSPKSSTTQVCSGNAGPRDGVLPPMFISVSATFKQPLIENCFFFFFFLVLFLFVLCSCWCLLIVHVTMHTAQAFIDEPREKKPTTPLAMSQQVGELCLTNLA
jgi:hypothetical protein